LRFRVIKFKIITKKKMSAFLNYRRQFAASTLVEIDFSVRKGEKRVIAAAADIGTRMYLRTALADNNRSRFDKSAVRRFYSQILGI
jgi:hypothetical protein